MNMNIDKQVCSRELAKRLKKLGVKQESLYYIREDGEIEHNFKYCGGGLVEGDTPEQYSAFTVAELGEMLPQCFKVKDDMYYIEPNMNGSGLCCMDYIKYNDGIGTFLRGYPVIKASTEADARAKMLIYLLENKLITL